MQVALPPRHPRHLQDVCCTRLKKCYYYLYLQVLTVNREHAVELLPYTRKDIIGTLINSPSPPSLSKVTGCISVKKLVDVDPH